MKGGCTVGPTNNVSFRETPLEDLAEASNTAGLLPDHMNRKVENFLYWLFQVFQWDKLGVIFLKVLVEHIIKLVDLTVGI